MGYLARTLASWFGCGYLPWMPGTWGSIAAFLLAWGGLYWRDVIIYNDRFGVSDTVLTQMGTSFTEAFFISPVGLSYVLGAIALLITGLGWWASYRCLSDHTEIETTDWDPSWIVIDEVAGYFWALAVVSLFRPFNFIVLLIALIFFRFFDIKKPWPIGWIDRKLTGTPQMAALGIMADDVVAGILAGIFTLIAFKL